MRYLILMLASVLVAGCAPLTSVHQPTRLMVDVRDAETREPIADAVVIGSSLYMYYPEMQDNIFGQAGAIPSFVEINEPSGWRASTNANGSTQEIAAGGTPSSITVMARGYAPMHLNVEIDDAGVPHGAMLWTMGDSTHQAKGLRALECRVVVPQ